MTSVHGNQLQVRFYGVRGSIPSPSPSKMRYGGNTSCVEVEFRGQRLILDAGSGIRSLGEDLIREAKGNKIETTLLLSHAHWDHVQGLPFFGPAFWPENRINVLCKSGHGVQLQRALSSQMSPPHFPVRIDEMRGLGMVNELFPDATQVGDFVIQTIGLNHPGGCAGFRLDTEAASLAYLPDHEPFRDNSGRANAAYRELVHFVRELDILILDTQYTLQEYTRRVGWGHGCLPDSVKLAQDAGVRRLLLFHHDPAHDDDQIDQMVESARSLAVNPGLTIDAASENVILLTQSINEDRASLVTAAGSSGWPHRASVMLKQIQTA